MFLRRAAGLVALFLGALLALLFYDWQEPHDRYDRVTPRPIILEQIGDAPVSTVVPPPSPCAALVVSVVDADTGLPIAAATVLAVVDDPAARDLGFRLADTIRADATSDASGTARLSIAANTPTPMAVRAVATGFMPSEVPCKLDVTRTNEVHVSLNRGEILAGQLVDPRDRPVPDLDVVATHVSLPRRASMLAATGRRGREWVRGRSDSDGRFQLTGLAPGWYYLDVHGDGWRTVAPHPHPDPRRRVENDVVVAAGRTDIRLKVEAIRVFRILLVDGETGVPVDDPYARVTIQPDDVVSGTDPASSPALQTGDDLLQVPRGAVRLGVWTGVATLADPQSAPQTATVRAFAVGCRPAIAAVTLRLPSSLAGGSADEIRLSPSEPFDCTGTVVAICPEPDDVEAGLLTYPCARLELQRNDEVVGFCQGSSAGAHTWRFARVPCGRFQVRLDDGATVTDWCTVDVARGELSRIVLRRRPSQGVVIALQDDAGCEVFGADTCGVSSLARGGGSMSTLTIDRRFTDYHEAGGRQVRAVLPLEPGWYRCDILKAGYAGSWTDFEVRPGEVVPITVSLKVINSQKR